MIENLSDFFNGKDILVTGGCGSVGSEIVRQLLKFDVKRVRVFDTNESAMFHLNQELGSSKVRELIGDVRDKSRLRLAMKGADIVFHCAALKHVPMCEYNPFEAVNTNVIGTQNAIEAAREEGVERFLSISTDKAVNPINTMGATKLLSEKLVLNAPVGDVTTKFSCVRFGNVLNSSGSVIPIFSRQIKNGIPVTITSEHMTRFFMSMSDAVKLVLRCASDMKGHEIFILKMNAVRIVDLASVMINELAPKYGRKPEDIERKIIGVRPGEKLHESLITEEEARHVEDRGDIFVLRPGIVTPHFVENERLSASPHPSKYVSKDAALLSQKEIRDTLKREGIL